MDLLNDIGGGQILHIKAAEDGYKYLSESAIAQYNYILFVKILICCLLVFVGIKIILYILNIKRLFVSKSMSNQLNYITAIKEKEQMQVKINEFMFKLVSIVDKTPFVLSREQQEELDFKIKRIGIKNLSGLRNITAKEFNALVRVAQVILCAIMLLIMPFTNIYFCILIIAIILLLTPYLCNMVLTIIIHDKDNEILENFADMYLMVHYSLKSKGQTPFATLLKSYVKTTNSKEMKNFINVCLDEIDTYGEYQATTKIASIYKELPPINKLMRLLKQMHEGGNIEEELEGFKKEILKAKEYELKKKEKKLVEKAQFSFNILLIILIQAILSAMAIYLPDISAISNFLG